MTKKIAPKLSKRGTKKTGTPQKTDKKKGPAKSQATHAIELVKIGDKYRIEGMTTPGGMPLESEHESLMTAMYNEIAGSIDYKNYTVRSHLYNMYVFQKDEVERYRDRVEREASIAFVIDCKNWISGDFIECYEALALGAQAFLKDQGITLSKEKYESQQESFEKQLISYVADLPYPVQTAFSKLYDSFYGTGLMLPMLTVTGYVSSALYGQYLGGGLQIDQPEYHSILSTVDDVMKYLRLQGYPMPPERIRKTGKPAPRRTNPKKSA